MRSPQLVYSAWQNGVPQRELGDVGARWVAPGGKGSRGREAWGGGQWG